MCVAEEVEMEGESSIVMSRFFLTLMDAGYMMISVSKQGVE